MNLVWNSFITAAVASALATFFGVVVALFAAGLPRTLQRVATGLAAVSLVIPPFLVTNCWLHYLGQTGVWHSWLPFNIFSLGGTTWLLSLLTWPIVYFFVSAAWQRIDPALIESDLQLSGWNLLRSLLFPIARAALVEGALLAFILSLNNFAVPAILQVKVAPAEAWIRFNTEFDTMGALKVSWLNILLPLVALLWFSGRVVSWSKERTRFQPHLLRRQLGNQLFLFTSVLAVLVLTLSAALPIYQLLSVKRTWTELPGALAAGTSAIQNSIIYSAGAATLLLLLVLVWRTAIFVKRRTANFGFAGKLLAAASWVPFLVPGVILGIALIFCFNRDWSSAFYASSGIVLTAFILRYLGPGSFAINRAFETLDPALTDAAVVEGANRFEVLKYAVWPQVAGRLGAAWYVIFLLCIWDVESLVLVVPPGGETLSLRIFNFLHYGHNAQVNALCFALLLLAICPLLLALLIRSLNRIFFARQLVASVLGFALLVVLPGCRRHYAENETPLHSAMFASVQIIGTRGVGVGQFNKPRSVAVDEQDNLYVADMTGRIQKFSPDGKFLLSWQMPQTELGKPKGMTRDLAGNIVVLEPHYQRVNHFSPQGKLIAQWGHKGTNAGEFMLPRGVAINSHNEAFVGEYSSMERVQKFQLASNLAKPSRALPAVAASGKLLLGFGRPGNAPGEFNRPEGLFVDKSDQLFVADSCNHRIQVFARDGTFLRTYGKAGSAPGEFSYPYDICLDPQGNQYVCEFGNSRIQIFDPANKTIEIIGKAGGAPGEFSNPWGLALDSHGNLYVADSQNHRVQKLIRRHPISIVAKN